MNMTVERADNVSIESDNDHVSIKIEGKLTRFHNASSEHSIFRVYDRLREENEDAYEPRIISIGPYHHDKPKLKPMEQQKLQYLQQLLERKNECSVDRYVMAMRGLEERARECYADPIGIDSDEFVEMMLLDSCFIIEFFRKCRNRELKRIDDPLFKFNHIYGAIMRDLTLLENQLPFFILLEFFNMTIDNPRDDLISMAQRVLYDPGYILTPPIIKDAPNIKHLLGLLHHCQCSSFKESLPKRNYRKLGLCKRLIKSTTELQEVGIRFKSGKSLFHISFTNGVMELPILEVYDHTEAEVRNLIAYEQYLPTTDQKVVTDYFILLDCLVNTPKDVEILRHHRIFENRLGDDNVILAMINKLVKNVYRSEDLSYSDVFDEVYMHCWRLRYVWIAEVNRKYFQHRWAAISFFFSFSLLLLTAIQTFLK